EFNSENCKTSNTLQPKDLNKPCLLKEMTADNVTDTRTMQRKFYLEPLGFFEAYPNYAANYQVINGAGVTDNKILAWMPYIGLDANSTTKYQPESKRKSFWNTYLITADAAESEAVNAEYGAVLEG